MDSNPANNIEVLPKAISAYPLSSRLKLFVIKSLSTHRLAANNDFHHQITDILQGYHRKVDDLVNQSNDLIKGQSIPDLSKIHNIASYFTTEEILMASQINLSAQKFEGYWAQVILNSNLYAAVLDEELDLLYQIDEIDLKSKITRKEKKFTVNFKFNPNEFFSNTNITCTIRYDIDDNLIESKTNKIYWSSNKNIFNILTKSNKNAGGFFKLFKRFDSNSENGLLVKYKMDISFIASELIHEIIPHSFHYYLGLMNIGMPHSKSGNKSGGLNSTTDNDEDCIMIEKN
jgi:Nucleosome assembly protein (NAP)